MPLFACTIFASAFLLFLVQPIIAKQILPWFGGSASVWATCLVFFQTTLLLGYAYADFTVRRLRPRTQVRLHVVLLVASDGTAYAAWHGGDRDSGRFTGWLAAWRASRS